MGLEEVKDGLMGFVSENKAAVAVGAGVAAVGTGVLVATAIGNKTSKKRRTHTKRGRKLDRAKFNKREKWEVAYRKRKRKLKKTRRKKIYYAKKTGQPYILLASGKAKFIKGRRKK